jgi:primosomal protein N' (replication factor Y)
VPRTVEVLPDVTGLDRTFHYSLSTGLAPVVGLGTIVRVELHGRRVRGWVVGVGTPIPAGVELRPVLQAVSAGPPAEIVELCRWVAWRYAGRLRVPLLAASPERVVRASAAAQDGSADLSRPREAGAGSFGAAAGSGEGAAAARPATAPDIIERAVSDALSAGDAVLRLPPAAERLPVVEAVVSRLPPGGTAIILVETHEDVQRLSRRLQRLGRAVACLPDDWAVVAAGGGRVEVVIGTRNAVFAPCRPDVMVVLDAHSESYRSPKAPTFDARVVAAERARRVGGAVLFVTPCPSVELLGAPGRKLLTLPPSAERNGWGTISVLDTREEDPAEGGYPSRLVSWIREAASSGDDPVVCILNRVGRARLLTCTACRLVQRCLRCGTAQVQLVKAPKGAIGVLTCPRCEHEEPAVCPSCGTARLRVARPGVSRAREQLAAVTGLEVGEVSGPHAAVPTTPVLMATKAALYRVRHASLVVWLDFDQELLAPRMRAAEEAFEALARSVRLVGGRVRSGADGPGRVGRVVIRTSLPEHEVVRGAQQGQPGSAASAEDARRRLLALPPYSGLAGVTGDGAEALVARLPDDVAAVRVGVGGGWLLRAGSEDRLADVLGALAADEPGGWVGLGVRVEMNPLDV